MPLSLSDFTEVVGEITPVLTGGWIQKVHQPFPDAITLEVRTPGQTYVLFLSANAQTARLHLLSRRLPNPPEPPSFCQFLRASIQGYRIEQVEQVPYDRIVKMKVQGPDTALYLVTALTGRQANLFLLDGDHIVLRSLKPGPVKVGQPYHPPQRSLPTQHARQGKSHSAEAKQESPRIPSVSARRIERFPVSLFLEEKYLSQEEENARQHLQQERIRTLRKGVKKTRRRIDALSLDLEKAHRFREYGRYGELLKNHLGTLSKGQAEITVVDYFDESLPPLTLPLDPSRDAHWNLKDYFRKYRKYLGAEREIRPRLEQAEKELRDLEETLLAMEKGEVDMPENSKAGSLQHPQTSQSVSKRTKTLTASKPYRRFVSAEGFDIFVGKNARDNDELTFHVANPDDLWLHARGTSGSHVVIHLGKGLAAPPETLKDAAVLALLYSDLKKSGKGEVIYTHKKYVRKAKGQKPGAVTVTREKALWVVLDRTRLDRIKARTAG